MNRTALLFACCLAAGCRDHSPAPAAIAFLDPEGRSVTLDTLPVRRIVSTNQAATEWLVALGAAPLLVARTDYDRQAELAHLPSIGGGLETSAEAVATLHPDVLLGWRIRASVDLAHALRPFGIPVIAVEATDTAEAFHQLRVLAQLTGRERIGDSLAAALHEELKELKRHHCPSGSPTQSVMVVLWTDPPQTAGGGTWMSELLDVACLRNSFEDLASAWPNVSLEAITARQPDWILTSRGDQPGSRVAEFQAQPVWRDLEAVKSGHIIELDGDLFARVGPGMADWVRAVVSEIARVRTQ